MQFGHKKVLGEVRGWVGILFENQSINVCRDSGSDWFPGEPADPKHPQDLETDYIFKA